MVKVAEDLFVPRDDMGILEQMTEYEMKIYYNPFHHQSMIEDYEESITDLYYKSCGYTDFDDVFGISLRSQPVDILADKIIGLRNAKDALERKYTRHKQLLNRFMQKVTPAERQVIKRYFREQYHQDYIIQHPIIHQMKQSLYVVEHHDRKERERQRVQERLHGKYAIKNKGDN